MTASIKDQRWGLTLSNTKQSLKPMSDTGIVVAAYI